MSSTTAAFRLSALAIAAGSILGLASHAAAQSRVERAERALAQAQKELDAARREADRSDAGNQKAEMNCDGNCNGCDESCDRASDDQGARADLTADDDDDQPRKIEKRVIVRGGHDGDTCPICGRPMEGGKMKFPANLFGGEGGNFKVFRLGGEEGGPFKVFRMGGEGGGSWSVGGPVHVETQGKVIILDDEGHRREFNFGGNGHGEGHGEGNGEGHGEGHTIILRGDGHETGNGRREERRIEIRRGGGEGGQFFMEGDGLKKQRRIELKEDGGEPRIFIGGDEEGDRGGKAIKRRIEIRGDGEGKAGHSGISGKVIIVGPDGQTREFNLGGDEGKAEGDEGSSGTRGGKHPHIEIRSLRDGDAPDAHQDLEGARSIRVRRLIRGITL